LKDIVNGGFMVLNRKVFDYIKEDGPFEEAPLINLAKIGEIAVYEHNGFWKSIDTYKDILAVEKMCKEGSTPWKIWE